MNNGSQHLVILIRHAKRTRRWDLPESTHWMTDWNKLSKAYSPGEPDFGAEGLGRTFALAGRLCDEFKILSGELQNKTIVVTDILYSGHTVARQTAEAYVTVLNERSKREGGSYLYSASTLRKFSELDPEKFSLKGVIKELDAFKKRETDERSTPALIVVGHQPHLTQIARGLLRYRPLKLLSRSALPGDSLPLGNSEVACIQLGYRPRLLWLLTEKPKELLAELKDKIKSKYDVAKFFLGAFVVNIGLLLNAGIWDNINFGDKSQLMVSLLAALGIVMALGSLIFAAATLFSYDSLMMPESLWSESTEKTRQSARSLPRKPPKWSVLRPPSQAQVILFYEMMHVWKCFFMPAIGLAFSAILFLLCSLVLRDVSVPPLINRLLESLGSSWAFPLVLVLLAILALGMPWWLYLRWQPRLGSED